MKLTFSFDFPLFLNWNELMRESSKKCMYDVSCWCLCMHILSNFERNALHKFANFIFQIKQSEDLLYLNPFNAWGQDAWKKNP